MTDDDEDDESAMEAGLHQSCSRTARYGSVSESLSESKEAVPGRVVVTTGVMPGTIVVDRETRWIVTSGV